MLVKRVCIVGLGLMGGSLALALRLAHRMALRPFPLHLTLVDTDPKTQTAVQNLADVVTGDFAAGVRDADLLVLATPVRTILRLLTLLPDACPSGCMVIDLGSSKAAITAAMDALPQRFAAIGGHPMCGRETAGFGVATPDLFRGKTFVLCATQRTTPEMAAQAQIMIDLIGAVPLHLSPTLHDELVAAVSHLPYLAAAALMQTASRMSSEHLWPVSASGFRDTSRVSGTDPTMMLDILLTNKTAVLQQLAHYQEALTAVADWIEQGDEAALRAWLTQTQAQHQAYKREKR